MKNKSALLLGASGLVGGHCLKYILEDAQFGEIRALVRAPLGIKHKRLREHIVDFNRVESFAGLLEVDDIFCCLGTTIKTAKTRESFYTVDFTYPYSIAREAAARGAKQFLIITAMGANPRSLIFYNRVKGEVEEAVRELPFSAVHIFRPSLLLGERREYRAGEKMAALISPLLIPLLAGPLKKYRPIRAETVARAMDIVAGAGLTGGIYESDRIQEICDRNRA